ncbi:HEPN domain-containing protein [Microbispora triticiradicis]|uniref:ApeA N-terminal domain 1-containing protein n=1 Tax=Microbispora triticiradicis TaxID=2200763 RepID=UPI001AD6C58F|nr:HEPN domain-containing protein [Microbispora triticiradicis]MBO4271275.1 hypothetical protein [Microbispora triticiradicis]
MDAFQGEGIFWLPGHEDDKVAGRITFDPKDGATLELIGRFDYFSERSGQFVRIVGVAARKVLTLDRCFRRTSGFEAPGVERETYRVNRILAGAHYDDDEEFIFDQVVFSFDHLLNWMEASLLTVDYQESKVRGRVDKVTATLEGFSKEEATFPDGRLCLGTSWQTDGDLINEATLRQSAYLQITYSTPQSLGAILNHVGALQDLITLTTDSPATPLYISMSPAAGHGANMDERVRVDFYAGQSSRRAPSSPAASDMLLTLQQVGGTQALAGWLGVAHRYGRVLGSLMAIRYSTFMYMENRFGNAINAAESFHRLRFSNALRPSADFKKYRQRIVDAVPEEDREWLKAQLQFSNEPRLRHRIEEMIEFSASGFAQVVEDADAWARLVVQVRNRLTHEDKRRPLKVNPGDLHYLSESVYLLVMLCLLSDTGVSPRMLTSLAQSPSILFLRDKIRGIVTPG